MLPLFTHKPPHKNVLGVVLGTFRHICDLKAEIRSGGLTSTQMLNTPNRTPFGRFYKIVGAFYETKTRLLPPPHPAHPTPLTTVSTTVSIAIFTHTGKRETKQGGLVVRFHPVKPQSIHSVVHLVLPLCCGVGHYIQPVDLSVVCVHHGVVIIKPRCISVDVVPTRNGSHVYWRRRSCAVS